MQNTRFSTLIEQTNNQLNQWLTNPWRKLSLLIISVLFGYFFGNAISTVAGQKGDIDVSGAGLVVILVEITNRVVYGSNRRFARFLFVQIIQGIKIGVTYSLFLEAFKLGS